MSLARLGVPIAAGRGRFWEHESVGSRRPRGRQNRVEAELKSYKARSRAVTFPDIGEPVASRNTPPRRGDRGAGSAQGMTAPSRTWRAGRPSTAPYARRNVRSRTSVRATGVQRERADTGSRRVHRRYRRPPGRRGFQLRNHARKRRREVPAARAARRREPPPPRTRRPRPRRSRPTCVRPARADGAAARARRRAGRLRPRRWRRPRGRPRRIRSRTTRRCATGTRSSPGSPRACCRGAGRDPQPTPRHARPCSAPGRRSSRFPRDRTPVRRPAGRIHAAPRPRRWGTETGPRASAKDTRARTPTARA